MRVALISAMAALVGCVAEAPLETKKSTAPIIDGVPSTAEDDAAVWVGVLTAEGYPQGSCSGVLIAENVVLTARHCVSRTSGGGIACTKDGTPIAGGGVRSDYPAEQLAIVIGPTIGRDTRAAARGKQVFNSGASNLCNNDIAVIVLDRKIAGAKIAPMRMEKPPVRGEKILAVGWGVANTGGGRTRKRRADIPIARVGPSSSASGAIGPREFEIGEGICSGDSGGPGFSMETGAVLGVVSRGGNGAPYNPDTDPPWTQCVDTDTYTTHNIYTRVDGFPEMFAKAFALAETDPWLEGGPDPRKAKSGEACDAPEACRTGLCVDGKCVDPCVDGACGDGFTCREGACVPNPPPAPAADPNADIVKGGTCAMSPVGDASLAWLALSLGLLAIRRRR